MVEKITATTKYWWLYLVFGILVLIIGGNFLANPLSALTAITFFVGLYLIISGSVSAIISIVDRKIISLWGLHLIINILVLIAGIFMFTRPSFAASFLWLICGVGFLLEGISLIALSIGLKKVDFPSWIAPLIFGILIVIVSILIITDPLYALTFVAIFVSIGVICFGINLIVLAIQFKPSKK